MSTFGPQQQPPKVRCLFCHYGIPHQHHDGNVPLLPCLNCWVGLHDLCDPLTWFCCCTDTRCSVNEGGTNGTNDPR